MRFDARGQALLQACPMHASCRQPSRTGPRSTSRHRQREGWRRLDEAIAHINHYGSHHTDTILNRPPSERDALPARVDSASVMVNASTRCRRASSTAWARDRHQHRQVPRPRAVGLEGDLDEVGRLGRARSAADRIGAVHAPLPLPHDRFASRAGAVLQRPGTPPPASPGRCATTPCRDHRLRLRPRHVVELECRLSVRAEIHTQFPRMGPPSWVTTTCSICRCWSDLRHRTDRCTPDRMQSNACQTPSVYLCPGAQPAVLHLRRGVAYRAGSTCWWAALCETHFSGYPDCRDNTLKALQVSLSLGMDTRMTLETPLSGSTRRRPGRCRPSWRRAADRLSSSTRTTCYLGDRCSAMMGPWLRPLPRLRLACARLQGLAQARLDCRSPTPSRPRASEATAPAPSRPRA